MIEEQFNKKYEEKLCRNILGVYETGALELRDDEYKKEISKIQKDIVSLKQEKVKNDDDFVKYVRKQDDLRNEIMEKKSKLASEREICLDFEKQLLTKKGYEERVALLEHLKVDRRKEVAQKLKEAREQGDLSENAEYDAAKDEQRDIETQIAELEEILKNAEVVQDNNTDKDAIKMESVVKLHDVEYDEDIEYVIVGSSEADSLNNKISNESPLGAAMLGKKVGDTVKVEAPAGVIEYKIISVQND